MTLTKSGSTFYTYESSLSGNGSVTSEQDTANGNWTYGYDANNRLSSSSQNSGEKTFSYVYDRWGNRWQQNAPQGGPTANLTFNTSTNQLATSGYFYDAAGERTKDALHNYTYDAEGRVLQVDGGSTATYSYDAAGNRVEKTTLAGTQDFIFNLDGRAATVMNPTTETPVRESTWWNGNKLSYYTYGSTPTTTYFVHQTPVGSVRGLTSVSGTIYAYNTSDPFGDGVTWYDGSNVDTLLFGSLDYDNESGLDHAWARQYSSSEAVWTIPDPYTGSYNPTNPQSFNRYAYALNSPLVFSDRSGLEGDDDDDDDDDDGGGQNAPPPPPPNPQAPQPPGGGLGDDPSWGPTPYSTPGSDGFPGSDGTPGPPPGPPPGDPGDAEGQGGFGGLGGPGGSTFHDPTLSTAVNAPPRSLVNRLADRLVHPTAGDALNLAFIVGTDGLGELAEGGAALARAKALAGALGASARWITIAVTETKEGTTIVSSSEKLVRPVVQALLRNGEVAGEGVGHAEVTGVKAAKEMGLTPTGVAASRAICPSCADFLKTAGVAALSAFKGFGIF
jgi:RHS repeat-associated protein